MHSIQQIKRLGLVVYLLYAASAHAVTPLNVNASIPDFDRWMYPFNATPGGRNLSPLFEAIGDGPSFDDRDGQFVVGFDTIGLGLDPAAGYILQSVTVTATHAQNSFTYDPTYDSYTTYLDSEHEDYTPDEDSGRPLELHGVAWRNGFTGGGFAGETPDAGETLFFEDSFFGGAGDTSLKGVRSAYPLGFDSLSAPFDASNNVFNEVESNAWAIGQSTSGLSPGDTVPSGTPGFQPGETFAFEVDLGSPDITRALHEGLSDGGLFFAITTLASSGGQTGGLFPNLYTRDNFDPASVPASLSLELIRVDAPEIAGDLSGDGTPDTEDIALFEQALSQGSRASVFDLNGDDTVDAQDGLALLDQLGTIPGDFDLNYQVDVQDLSIWATNFGVGGSFIQGDADFNGQVDVQDLSIWATRFGSVGRPGFLEAIASAIAIPEPASCSLLTLGLFAFAMRRRQEQRHTQRNH